MDGLILIYHIDLDQYLPCFDMENHLKMLVIAHFYICVFIPQLSINFILHG